MAVVSRSQKVQQPDAKPSTTHWLSLIQNIPAKAGYGYCPAQVNVYNAAMQTTLELLEKAPESLIAAGLKSAFVPRNRAVIAADRGCGSVTRMLEPARNPTPDGRCLWCGRTFTPRATGGSTQKFCCTPATVLDRGAPLDDAGYRGGPALGRLPKGVSRERARCPRGIPLLTRLSQLEA
jgi:hypothetical protein